MMERKIINNIYKAWRVHREGTFFKKDPTKVDMNRMYIVLHAIEMPKPLLMFVDMYMIKKIHNLEILKLVKENFGFRPEISK
uniref:Uncharacterized protein n=1 Tax=Physcomitrium patens TaxID=3218 RepID=A0A7I4FKA8_PHYPA